MSHNNHIQFAPTTFKTKDNRTVRAIPHVATFKGKHNASKSKVLLVLYHRKYNLGLTTGLSAIEINRSSGVDYGYLRRKLTSWCDWQYLNRSSVLIHGRNVFSYSIADRGRRFVEDIIPPAIREQLVKQIRDFKNSKKIIVKGY